MSTKRLLTAIVLFTLAVFLAAPAPVLAQRGGGRRYGGPVVRVGVGWGWGYGWGPYYPYGGPWGWGGWGWGPWPYYYDYRPWASARIEILPKQTEVFVDGYLAGIVDDFDGIFQRLNVWPGEHEVTLYLDGYKTQRHRLYFSEGTTANIKGTMEKLTAGETSEPPPQPEPRETQRPAARQSRDPQPRQEPQQDVTVQQEPVRYGAVSVKVQPEDAVIAIDDQIWTAPAADQRLNVQLASGRHHIQVRKDGFVTYAEDILIRPGATLTLNVNLTKK